MNIIPVNPSSGSTIIEGQHNFRDLGGLPTGDGFMTRKGMIYRSGDLSLLTDNDIAVLNNLNISLIIDFRSDRERIKRPNRPIPSVKKIRTLPINETSRETAMEYIIGNDDAGLEKLLINYYRRIIRENQEEYRQFLNELAYTPHIPVIFHCVAGKDRTGLATLFLLTALGVELDFIFRNYTASNIHNAQLTAKIIHEMNEKGHNGEIIRPLLEAKREYLEAAITEIREKHENLHSFVVDTLKADITKLKERLLEPVICHI